MEELASGLVHALVGVGAEIIALGLEQVCGKDRAAVLIEERESRAEGRNGDALLGGCCDDVAPAFLAVLDLPAEVIVKEKIRELRILVVGLLDLAKEAGADDAASAPHEGDAPVVEIPSILLRSRAHEHVALRVADDLGSIESALDVLDELLLFGGIGGDARKEGLGSLELAGGLDALVLEGGDATGINGLGHQGDGDSEFLGIDDRPLARALLTGGV